MDEWKQKTIGELCEKVTSGGTPFRGNASYYINGIIPWIKTGELHDGKIYETDIEERITEDALNNSSAKLFPKDTILMAMYGDGKTIGSLGIIQQPSTSNQACSALIANSEICLPKFLFYSLIVWRDGLIRLAYGGAQRNLTSKIIQQYEIPVPSLDIQKKIAAILSAYDDLIENNLKQIRLLEEMAQITYQEWFVRLKFPNHENTPIDETTGLPIGWHFGKVIDLIELQRGFDLPIQDREHGSIPIIASTGTVGFHSSYKVQGAGVVTGRSGTIGQVMFVDSDFFPLNTTLWVKSYKSCKPIFVKHLLDSLNLESLCGGAAVPSLDRKAVHVQKAVIPPAKLMNDFDVYAASHYEAMKVLRSQNQLLKEARDILLPRLMTGKITVE